MNYYKYQITELINILSKNNIEYLFNDSFEYADINGDAYYTGTMLLFSKKNTNYLSAIVIGGLIEETYSESLLKIFDVILQYIGFPITLGDHIDKVIEQFGSPYHIDTALFNKRLQYSIDKNYWVSIGVNDEIVISIEIIFDGEIIRNVREARDNS